MQITAKANKPQARFLNLPHKNRAFIGGFGSGKTWVGSQAQCINYWQVPYVNQGYFAPTYPIIRDVFYPTIEEVAFQMGLNVNVNEGNHEVHFYRGRKYRGTTICRSMDNPNTIRGFKIGHATIDELDTLPILKAEDCWRKIIARMRYNLDNVKNGIDVTTTPEGFRFCHKLFVQMLQENTELNKNYGMIQASTRDNAKNLPKDYIPSLMEIYPAELVEAYINGQFVNLTSGTVYRNYDRVRCNSNETMQPAEPLFVGMDFNVTKMAAAIFVQRPDGFPAVAELKDVFDTPAMIRILQEKYAGHRIIIYPDATGKNRETLDASKSDIALLTNAGFEIRVNSRNPAVKDRILSTNKALETGKIKVNAKACPTIARCLEQQAYDQNGEPDKSAGFDHMCFAGDTLVNTNMGLCRMDALPEVGLIESFGGGLVPYVSARKTAEKAKIVQVNFADGSHVRCTLDHLFLTADKWVKAVDLTGQRVYNNHKHSIKERCELWLRLSTIRGKSLTASFITYAVSIFKTLASGFTGLFTNIITEKYPRAIRFIMQTGIEAIISPKISYCCIGHNIAATTTRNQGARKWQNMPLSALLQKHRNGTHPPKGLNGISNNTSAQKTSSTKLQPLFVRIAERLSSLKTGVIKNISAPMSVVQQTVENPARMTRREIARFVASHSQQTNIKKSNIAPRNVDQRRRGGLLVTSVDDAGSADVYCLTVPSLGCFALPNGCIVSNCDAFSYFATYEFPIIRPMAKVRIGGI